MNVLLIATNRHRHPMPVMPFGACIVAEAAAGAGHRVRLLDLMFVADPQRAVAEAFDDWTPDVIGLSVRNIDNNDMTQPSFYPGELLPIIKIIRSRSKAPLVLGGAAVSVMAEELLRFTGADCAICGDGEAVFPELLEWLAEESIPEDLPGLAWFDGDQFRANPPMIHGHCRQCHTPEFRRWLDLRSYRRSMATVPLQTKLGCQFQCVYCTYRKIEGGTYRLLEPASAARAAAKLAAMGLRDVEVVDNVFNSPHWHALAVCEELARVGPGVRLQSLELNPAFLDDDLLTAMKRARFTGIGLTVESAVASVLQGLRKGYTDVEVFRAADIVSRHKLPCLWIFLLGGPGETPETVKETIAFAEQSILPRDVAFFNMGIRIYPGTELEGIARRQGVLNCGRQEMLKPVFYLSPEVDAGWLRAELKSAMARNLNFIDGEAIGLSLLPALNGIGRKIGMRPPLWRHTRHIRRLLRLLRMEP
jgi:radical SAM superfamily enzyme YgiQ (UPF0313 family)